MHDDHFGNRSENDISLGENAENATTPPGSEEDGPAAYAAVVRSAEPRFPRPHLAEIHRSRLRRGTKQVRADPVDLRELTTSLKSDGQLCPLFVVRTGEFLDGADEIFEILDGQRRFEASDGILETLQCFVFEPGITQEDLVAFQLVVNVNRANLSQADQARAVYELYKGSGAATVNEFVESDHGLSFGSVWLRSLVILGQAADPSASEAERTVFEQVQQGTLSVKNASEKLVAVRSNSNAAKPRRGRPKGAAKAGKAGKALVQPASLVEVFIADGFRISLKQFEREDEAFGDWELALVRRKKSRDLQPAAAGIERAAQAILTLSSAQATGLVKAPS